MDRNHELLQNDELYAQCGEMIKENIRAIQEQICSLRDYLAGRKKEILKAVRNISDSEGKGGASLEATRFFYDHAINELVKIEEVCQKSLINIRKDILTEFEDRLKPPSHVSSSAVKEAFDFCKDLFQKSDGGDKRRKCRCFWKNIDESILEDTEDILTRPKTSAPTAFDESDLKFKQEMTVLSAKLVATPKGDENSELIHENIDKKKKKEDFIEVWKTESLRLPSVKDELAKVSNLKFNDGEFHPSEIWSKVLDIQGQQYSAKWYLALCPQIEKIMKKRWIPALNFNAVSTFDFLSTIPDNGILFFLEKEKLVPLLANVEKEKSWLISWKQQFKTLEGKHLAATIIQSLWRGYRVRKKFQEMEMLYIAASVLWISWLSVMKRRLTRKKYLKKMLKSLSETRKLGQTLSHNFEQIISKPHVVLHVPSLGYPLELRRTFSSKVFAMHQNTTVLRVSFLSNPMAEVIYFLPIQSSDELLQMYRDLISSVILDESVINRVTFLALSEAKLFEKRSMNVSRILHCSEETLKAMQEIIGDRPAYFLPWVIDECDVHVSGSFEIPLLSSDVELQKKLLNVSYLTEKIEELDLLQPAHVRNITNYITLCEELAELIVINTEICTWLIKLNCDPKNECQGVFLINHISVPFMPLLRREREKHEYEWTVNPVLRGEFFERLLEHLPKVVSNVTRLTNPSGKWKDFYSNLQKFGCLLQAVPNEKNGKIVTVTLFVPGKTTGEKPKWTGTAEKIHFDKEFPTDVFMMPQTSFNNNLEPIVSQLAESLQKEGYFGYLAIDCYCYFCHQIEKEIISVVDIYPYYCHAQQYVDWIKFVIGGSYEYSANVFIMEDIELPQNEQKMSYLTQNMVKWKEANERFGIAISHLYHENIHFHSWSTLKKMLERRGIVYDKISKEGSHLILHDEGTSNLAMMTVVSSSMMTTLSIAQKNLKKLYRCLSGGRKKFVQSNFQPIVEFFGKLILNYEYSSKQNIYD